MNAPRNYEHVPGDSALIDKIVCEVKSQGAFDQFRRECMADVDTKPAYQNLRQRVEGSVSHFLSGQQWRPDMNKNQMREKLRRHITETGFLETGVERIVDQVVNPKINTVFLSAIEDISYAYLGIEKPKPSLADCVAAAQAAQPPPTPLHPPAPVPPPPPPSATNSATTAQPTNGCLTVDIPPPGTLNTMLPTDGIDLELEAVSPESDKTNTSAGSAAALEADGSSGGFDGTSMSKAAQAATANRTHDGHSSIDTTAVADTSANRSVFGDDFESPAFEPLEGRSSSALSDCGTQSGNAPAAENGDEDGDNSKLSAISGLTSQDSVGSSSRSGSGAVAEKIPNESFSSMFGDDLADGSQTSAPGSLDADRKQSDATQKSNATAPHEPMEVDVAVSAPLTAATSKSSALVEQNLQQHQRQQHDANLDHSSELSQVSSNSRLSIVTDRESPVGPDDHCEEAQMPRFNENSSNSHNANAATAAPETPAAPDAAQRTARPLQTSFTDIKQDEITFEGTRRHSICVDIKAEVAAADNAAAQAAMHSIVAPPLPPSPPQLPALPPLPPLPPGQLHSDALPLPVLNVAPPPVPSQMVPVLLTNGSLTDGKLPQDASLLHGSSMSVSSCSSASSSSSFTSSNLIIAETKSLTLNDDDDDDDDNVDEGDEGSDGKVDTVVRSSSADVSKVSPQALADVATQPIASAESFVSDKKTQPNTETETLPTPNDAESIKETANPDAASSIDSTPSASAQTSAAPSTDFKFETPAVDSGDSREKSRDTSTSSSSKSRHRDGHSRSQHSSSSSKSSSSNRDKKTTSSSTSTSRDRRHHSSSSRGTTSSSKDRTKRDSSKDAKDRPKESTEKAKSSSSHKSSSSSSHGRSSSSAKPHHTSSSSHRHHSSTSSSGRDKERSRHGSSHDSKSSSSTSSTKATTSSGSAGKTSAKTTTTTTTPPGDSTTQSPRKSDDSSEACKQRTFERRRSTDQDSNDGQPSPSSASDRTNNSRHTSSSSSSNNGTSTAEQSANTNTSVTPAASTETAEDFVLPAPMSLPVLVDQVLTGNQPTDIDVERLLAMFAKAADDPVLSAIQTTIQAITSGAVLKRPKVASNIYEARKLMKVRRQMERDDRKRLEQALVQAKQYLSSNADVAKRLGLTRAVGGQGVELEFACVTRALNAAPSISSPIKSKDTANIAGTTAGHSKDTDGTQDDGTDGLLTEDEDFTGFVPIAPTLRTALLSEDVCSSDDDDDDASANFVGFDVTDLELPARTVHFRQYTEKLRKRWTESVRPADAIQSESVDLPAADHEQYNSDGVPPLRARLHSPTPAASSSPTAASPSPDSKVRARLTRRPKSQSESQVISALGKRRRPAAAEDSSANVAQTDAFRSRRIKIDAHIRMVNTAAADEISLGSSELDEDDEMLPGPETMDEDVRSLASSAGASSSSEMQCSTGVSTRRSASRASFMAQSAAASEETTSSSSSSSSGDGSRSSAMPELVTTHVSPTPSEQSAASSSKENSFVPKIKKAVSRSLAHNATVAPTTTTSSAAVAVAQDARAVTTDVDGDMMLTVVEASGSSTAAPLPTTVTADSVVAASVQQTLATVQPKKNNNAASKASQQRYTSDDLYKPRPILLGSRSRRRGVFDNSDM